MSSTNAPVVLITGAARRIGAAIARTVHRYGAAVGIHYRHAGREALALAAELEAVRPGSTLTLQADLLDVGTAPALVAAMLERFGRLDGLVNNASSFYPTPLGQIDLAAWEALAGSNLRAPLFLAQAAAQPLRDRRGAIVNIVDIHAERPLRDYPLYCAAKAGLAGLTRALAIELAPSVRVNGVAPGAILWPEDGQFPPAEREAVIGHTLIGREGRPEDIARTTAFLLFEAPYMTGQILAVDGGRSAHL